MNQPELNGQDGQGREDQPLDPATLKIQAKLKRLLAGSSLIMLAGFVAVFAAIFYKINSSDSGLDTDSIPATIVVGPNAVIEDVELAGGRLMVLVREGDARALLYIDPVSGKQLGRSDFVAR